MKLPKTSANPAFVVGGVCLALGLVIGIGFAKDFWSEVTAAWIQAVGSIGAIAFGFLYVEHQTAATRSASEHQRRLDMEASRNSILAMSEFIEGRIRAAGKVLRDGSAPTRGDLRMYFNSFKADHAMASAFTIKSNHSSSTILCFSRYLGFMSTTLSELEELLASASAVNQSTKDKALNSATSNIELVIDALGVSRIELEKSLTAESIVGAKN
jgi:hypothetical protein